MSQRITAQEHLLPGDTVSQKWELAHRLGLDGIELRGAAGMADRLPELRAGAKAGVPMQSICVITRDFIGAFDSDARRRGIETMKELLTVAGEIGARGAVTPAAYGIHSNRLPPHKAPRPPEEDRAILIDALGTLGEHAAAAGVTVWLEPLNRYEDHMVNTVAAGADIARAVGLPSVRVMADLFHMNIEEANVPDAIRASAEFIDHVHLADSQRLEPGTGHTDFTGAFAALDEIGFGGVCAIECGLSGEAETSLGRALAHLRASGG